jgi:molybdopterin molybdotransferase
MRPPSSARVAIEDARAAVLERAQRLDSEAVYLDDALGRVLAVDARAPSDVPPFATAAIAGFAIRAADTRDRNMRLRVIGQATAGTGPGVAVHGGTAARIAAGAPIPEGAERRRSPTS